MFVPWILGRIFRSAEGTCAVDSARRLTALELLEPRTFLSSSVSHVVPFEDIIGAGPLVPSIAKSTLPPGNSSTAAVHGTTSFELTNDTDAPVKEKFTINIYATNGQYSEADAVVGQLVRTLSVKPSTPFNLNVPVKITPGGLGVGTYTLLAGVVDPAVDTQLSATGPTLTVGGSTATVSTTLVKSSIPGPIIAGETSKAIFTFRFTNTGSAPLLAGGQSAPFIVDLDAVNFARSLGGIDSGIYTKKNLTLKPGKSIELKIGLGAYGNKREPLNSILGGGSVQVLVLSTATNTTFPGDGYLNSPCSFPLTIVAPTVALSPVVSKDSVPTSLTAGEKTHGSAIVRITNNGTIPDVAISSAGLVTTTGNTTVQLIATPTDGGTAIPIAPAVSKKLPIKPGKNSSISIPVKQIPADLPAGSYILTAQVTDPNGNITTASSETVTVG